MEAELRLYRIAQGRLDDFVQAWTAGVLPLRRQFGFDIDAWTVPSEDLFVWVIRYAGPGTFAETDAAYYASPDRASLHPDPAQWIVENVSYPLKPVAPGA